MDLPLWRVFKKALIVLSLQDRCRLDRLHYALFSSIHSDSREIEEEGLYLYMCNLYLVYHGRLPPTEPSLIALLLFTRTDCHEICYILYKIDIERFFNILVSFKWREIRTSVRQLDRKEKLSLKGPHVRGCVFIFFTCRIDLHFHKCVWEINV